MLKMLLLNHHLCWHRLPLPLLLLLNVERDVGNECCEGTRSCGRTQHKLFEKTNVL